MLSKGPRLLSLLGKAALRYTINHAQARLRDSERNALIRTLSRTLGNED